MIAEPSSRSDNFMPERPINFAAHAPQYFPNLVCCHKALRVQSFVLADDLQFVTHGESNRMRLKTNEGELWLTMPVLTKGKSGQLIKEVRIDNALHWRAKHWKTLCCHYGRAPYFELYADRLEKIFRQEWKWLVDLNLAAFEFMHRALRMKCAWQRTSEWRINAPGTERIVEMGKRLRAEQYLTEQDNAKFLQAEKFQEAGIALTFFDFTPREYHQQYGAFVPKLSALDLLLNEGEEARGILMAH